MHFYNATHLVHGLLAATTAHSDTVDNKSLLGLVSKATSLVRARGACQPHNARQLTVFPASHTQQKAQNIALLPLPQLLQILQDEQAKWINVDCVITALLKCNQKVIVVNIIQAPSETFI